MILATSRLLTIIGDIMIYSSQDDIVADKYFSFANDVIGILALTLAVTSLQFQHPEPFAMIFFVVIMLWTFSKAGEYHRIAKRYVEHHRGIIGKLILIWKMNIYVVGVVSLFYVALGELNLEIIYSVFAYNEK